MLKKIVRVARYDWPLHFVLLFTSWLPDNVIILRLRGFLAHFFLGSCGKNLRLSRSITFYNPQNIRIGSNVYIAYGNWFSAGDSITIGDEVIIGPYCVFSSSNHTKINGSFRYGTPIQKPISVGNGSWIAGQCSVLSGSDIGNGVLVAANSVVNGKIEADIMCAGSPARSMKKI